MRDVVKIISHLYTRTKLNIIVNQLFLGSCLIALLTIAVCISWYFQLWFGGIVEYDFICPHALSGACCNKEKKYMYSSAICGEEKMWNTRLLDQRAGVVIDLSGLPVEPADSSWCDEVGSEVEVGRRKWFLWGENIFLRGVWSSGTSGVEVNYWSEN